MNALLLFAHMAATGWAYPISCCADYDCKEIPSERVQTLPQGYKITLWPGDHEFVTQGIWFLIDYGDKRLKDSPDGYYHICITDAEPTRPWTSKVVCLFVPPQAY